MPVNKGDGAFVFFCFGTRFDFKKIFTVSLLAVTLALCAFPTVSFADDLQDPTGRGWSCTGEMRPADHYGAQLRVGTRTCVNPDDSTQVWEERCVKDNIIQEAGAAVVDQGGNVIECQICITNGGETDCHLGDYVAYTTWGGEAHTTSYDPETGEPTEAVASGERTNPVGWVFDGLGKLTLEAVATIVWFITQLLVWMALFVLSIVGLFFNFVVTEFVIEMGKYITSPSATAVRQAWTMIRDLANIAIIGGLIAIAVGTIIGSEKNGIQKNLARLLIAALLVNFSYFFAGAIIDFSNFTARAAYQAVICPPDREHCGIASRVMEATDFDQMTEFGARLARAVSSPIGLAQELSGGSPIGASEADQEDLNNTSTPSANATYNVMLLIFICITTFVFLSAIALLVGRFVVLIFLIITSPIGIAGGAVPLLNQYATEWWKALWNQVMFAPVYFLLAGIALNILDQFKGALLTPNAEGLLGAFNGETVNASLQAMVGIIALFTVAIGFMWAALSTAKKMSADGAERFQDIYKATGAAFGWMPKSYAGGIKFLGGMALRETIGRGAHEFGHVYRRIAGRGRFDESKIPFVAAADRAMKKQLDKFANQKFLGADAYHTVHEEVKARGVELGEVEREQEQDGLAQGKLTNKQKKEHARLKAKRDGEKLSDAEARQLADLEEKERRGDTLTPQEAKLLADLRAKRSKAGLSPDEETELSKYQARINNGETLNEDDKAIFEDLRTRKERGGLTATEHAKFTELDSVVQNGGYLHQFEHAQKTKEKEFELGNKQLVNEQAEYDALRAKRASGATLSDNENEQLQYFEKRRTDSAAYATLKAKGNLTAQEAAELASLEERVKAGEILELRNKNGIETQEAFELRQKGRGKFGRKATEDMVAYLERLENDVTGERPLLAKLQAIEQQLPGDFLKRKYDEHPESLIEYASMLNSDDYNKFMKDPSIRRDIKNEMRKKRHGWYLNKVRDINEKKARGEVMEGTPEWDELNAVPYYYNMKRMSDREEFKDLVTSDVGEDLRKIPSFWNGGSLTGAFLGTRGALGAYERRDINTMKREAYYKHQRSLTGAYMLEGADDVYNDDGTLKDSYHIPNKGGSDRFAAAEEAWKNAAAKIKDADRIIDAGTASPETIQYAKDQKRWHQMILDTKKDANGNIKDRGVFVRNYADKEARATAVRAAQDRLAPLMEAVEGDDPEQSRAAMEKIRNDEELFVVYNQRRSEAGMVGFMEGKNAEEELGLVSMERTYSPATVIGKSASDLADMMVGSKYDIRFKRAIRTSFVIEKEDAEIQALVLNPDLMKAFGGYPTKQEVDTANDLRRQKYGPLQGETGAGPDARMKLPYNPAELG